jgi:phospholipase/carboxylesterase
VLCRGFGAPGTDLVPLAAEMCAVQSRLVGRTRFVFPQAPLELGGMGYDARAWWMIDVERFANAQRQGRLAEMADEVPEGLAAVRRQMTAAVDELLRGTRLDASRLVLGGFSQGAMVATDLALRMEDAPAGLIAFSGTLLNRADWAARAQRRRGLRVFQSHGRQDPLLPFANAELLRDLLASAGLSVDFLPFPGAHTISAEGLERAAALAASALPA